MIIDRDKTGYASRAYADSLSEFGEVIHLKHSNGYLLKKPVPGCAGYFDAIGLYPLFFCSDWSLLQKDFEELPDTIISIGLVADPFGDFTPELLEQTFDVVNPYKKHFTVDVTREIAEIGSRHHRREARKAYRSLSVQVCENPAEFVDIWEGLYKTLRRRYSIQGIRGFSHTAFEKQLSMPEIVVHQAFHEDKIIGAQLFYQQDDVVHCHLGAVSPIGYELNAFYALDQFSFSYFSDKARRLDLGGGIGLNSGGHDGLSYYKKGWSSDLQQVYFCGRIINPEMYEMMAQKAKQVHSSYFPTYRAGEYL
ncbi:GNAT family N-acetyltransferase [Pontiella agarivorans]|uniref:GNAT family N-acetyltransferase n=1 Tax=Pontiella agarivorans TaxID=3038953 RepID=A0ABU5MWX1_9BACT|nr:GNAT family N-acetyltransferase [Pontiella agarivorans]MDZ8118707.1 GNAT family N-acetyltransferase [Pontiella agarivorans]